MKRSRFGTGEPNYKIKKMQETHMFLIFRKENANSTMIWEGVETPHGGLNPTELTHAPGSSRRSRRAPLMESAMLGQTPQTVRTLSV